MTNETNYKPCRLKCNGATKDFPFEFQVHKNEELFVNLINTDTQETTLLVEGSDYSATLEAVGGNVTTKTAYANNYVIEISRQTSYFQGKTFSTSGGFQASEIENAFDRVSCGLQDMDYNIETFKEEYSAETNQKIEDFRQEILDTQQGFELEINTLLEDVTEASKKINMFEEGVNIAVNSSVIATEQATIATEKVGELVLTKEQAIAQINEVSNSEKIELNEIIQDVKDIANNIKILTTLEIGDIGFTQMAIDETKGLRRILNGQLIIQDQYQELTKRIKATKEQFPDRFCTEEEWQTEVTMNTFGLCGKFVIDNEGGTIRLPKYPNYFIAGLANIAPVVGNGMTLGLTNGTDYYGIYQGQTAVTANLTLYGTNINTAPNGGSPTTIYGLGVTPDSSKSGIEAQINEKQIAGQYFIQVATGAETEDNIINEIELNNPFSLLDYKFSEYELNNISWLRSNGQYNSKAIYPAVYDLLLKIYNGTETKAGVSVKLSTETFTDYDFVLNTADETFRLPIKVKLASGKAVVGNGMALGLNNGTTNFGFTRPTDTQYLIGYPGAYGVPTGSGNLGPSLSSTGAFGVTTDPNYSGIELSDSDLYLYFYVGETVQNANLINAGRIQEKVAEAITRMDCKAYITETYQNGTSWYRIWSDGWCEQGGVCAMNSSWTTYTFLKSYKNTDYYLFAQLIHGINANYCTNPACVAKISNSQFKTGIYSGSASWVGDWYACGYVV